jgi:predicted nucleotidyltransferase
MASPTPYPQLETSLAQLKAMQHSIAQDFQIKLVGITGSVGRQDANVDSDIDVVAETLGRISLFEVVDAQAALKAKLGYEVDLIFLKDMPDYKKALMLRDLVPLL